jgi:hypothetical protein
MLGTDCYPDLHEKGSVMNWMVRNIAALLLGVLTSGLVVAILLYYEARDGSVLFSYNGQTLTMMPFLAWIPIGPALAGLVGASGYLVGVLALRLRPAAIALLVIVAFSAGVVWVAQSAEFSLYLVGWPQPNGGPTKNMATFAKFLRTSAMHSQLHVWSPDYDSYESEEQSSFFTSGKPPSASGPVLAPSGDSSVDGLSGGVSGMMSSQDMSQTGPGKQLSQMGEGFESFKARVQANSGEWERMGMQTMAFAAGGLMVLIQLRKQSYCKDCMLLLNKKGERSRYYSRSRDMRAAVDIVLTKARDKQLQQAIHAQLTKGVDHDGSWSEYCSTMEIRRCPQCRLHMMRFMAKRKEDERWNDIDVLGFTSTSLEPLDFG